MPRRPGSRGALPTASRSLLLIRYHFPLPQKLTATDKGAENEAARRFRWIRKQVRDVRISRRLSEPWLDVNGAARVLNESGDRIADSDIAFMLRPDASRSGAAADFSFSEE